MHFKAAERRAIADLTGADPSRKLQLDAICISLTPKAQFLWTWWHTDSEWNHAAPLLFMHSNMLPYVWHPHIQICLCWIIHTAVLDGGLHIHTCILSYSHAPKPQMVHSVPWIRLHALDLHSKHGHFRDSAALRFINELTSTESGG